MIGRRVSLALAALMSAGTAAQALTFGLNTETKALLADFTAQFTVITSGEFGGGSFGTAAGTTNGGVTWSSDYHHYLDLSNGSESPKISGGSLNTAPAGPSEWIHSGAGFTLTFSRNVTAILFSVSDNESAIGNLLKNPAPYSIEGSGFSTTTGGDGIDTIHLSNANGGFVLYEGLSGNTFTNLAADLDGHNFAFAVQLEAVPLPGAGLLLPGALALMVGARRRARHRPG